jgi:hypothetical protein
VEEGPIGGSYLAFDDDVAQGGKAFGEAGGVRMRFGTDAAALEHSDFGGASMA